MARPSRGRALCAGQKKQRDARQSDRGRRPPLGRGVVLDAHQATNLSRAESPPASSFVDARVSATAPWPKRLMCECDTRERNRIMPKSMAYCMALTNEQNGSSSTNVSEQGGWIYRFSAVPCCSVMVPPLSRRSGCVPAWPYPPLRSVEVYPNPAPRRRAGRRKVQKNP